MARAACNESPMYVLYHEILNPKEVPEELAEVAGIPQCSAKSTG